jgi:hypothetical protein
MRKGCHKVIYATEERAWEVAAKLIEDFAHDDLKVYLCHRCKNFHVTTAPVQMHDWWWRRIAPKRIQLWLKQRENFLNYET